MEVWRLREVEDINERVRKLHRRRDELLTMDTPAFGDLVEAFRGWAGDHPSPSTTKVFIFLALYYYNPMALIGARMRKHLRRSIAEALGVRTPTVVSARARDLMFTYENYKAFRARVDELHELATNKF